jgi:uncharacterized membrane protein (DUF2068 family)
MPSPVEDSPASPEQDPTPPVARPASPLVVAGLHTVALLEATKGLLALAGGALLLLLTPESLRHATQAWIQQWSLDPTHWPARLLTYIGENTSSATLHWLAAGVFAYALIRLVEAWGLWRQRAWAEWLGAISGMLYIPFEIHELTRRVNVLTVGVLIINVAIVVFLLWSTRLSRQNATVSRKA